MGDLGSITVRLFVCLSLCLFLSFTLRLFVCVAVRVVLPSFRRSLVGGNVMQLVKRGLEGGAVRKESGKTC